MAEHTGREHYIPIRKSDLIALLSRDSKLSTQEQEPFQQFCRLTSAIFHFEYLQQLEDLKDAYAPFDPDRETREISPASSEEKRQAEEKLFATFIQLMEKANFRHLSREDIKQAMEGGSSDWGLNMHVDFDVFERLEMFARGDTRGKRYKRNLLTFWKLQEKEVDMYQRLVFITRLRKHKRLGAQINTEGVYLKIFKEIPKLDLEMLLPGTRLMMPGFQKLTLGGSLLGGLVSILYKVIGDIWAFITGVAAGAVSAILLGPGTILLGFGYKQYYSYTVAKQRYTLQLTESLYYQNLDNNIGVLTRLLDEAEEQECRETILAYYFLWKHAPEQGWTSEQLDDYVELYLESSTGLKVDFEIGDAREKKKK